MTPVKYIEVIFPEAIVQIFTDMVDMHSFEAYSVNSGLSGKSRSGLATAGLCDAAVTILCDESQAKTLIPAIAQFLERYGGAGCVIEAQGFSIAQKRNTA